MTAGNGEDKFSATSSWEWRSENGETTVWSPGKALPNTQGVSWASSHQSDREWLEIDLGDKRKITGKNILICQILFSFELLKIRKNINMNLAVSWLNLGCFSED